MSVRLAEKIREIEQRHTPSGGDGVHEKPGGVLSTGWPEVDAALGGGLARGGLHEWFGLLPAASRSASRGDGALRRGEPWRPPLALLIHLAWRALDTNAGGLWSVWIGRRCFPYPAVLLRRAGISQPSVGGGKPRVDGDPLLMERSLFVAPRQTDDRLWAIDLALRSPAVSVVVADGSGFGMTATRRVQLAAKNHGTLALLVRPPPERTELSAAQTRWLVRKASEPGAQAAGPLSRAGPADGRPAMGRCANPAWSIEILHCKGVHVNRAQEVWRLEWNRAACTLHLSTPLADSTGDAQAPSANTGRGGGLRRRFA